MNHPLSIRPLHSLTALVAVGLSSFARAQAVDPIVPGEATVRVTSPAKLKQCIAALSQQYANVSQIDAISGRNTFLLSYGLAAGQTPEGFNLSLTALQANGTIVWGELNYGSQAAEGKTGSLWVSQVTIGPPQFATQYTWNLIGLSFAHQRSTGLGTKIAVLDTGIDGTHPQLAGSLFGAGYSVVGDASPNVEVTDSIDSDGDGSTSEMFGHGTFVAGLLTLVAPDAKLISVRVLDDDGHGDLYRIAKAMYWAIDADVDVINMSLGSTYNSQAVEDASIAASIVGIVVVGAAGNSNTDDPREYPACTSAAIGVAATDESDLKASFSNYDAKIDLSAPGDSKTLPGFPFVYDPAKSIISTVPGGGFAAWKGSSMATAIVSGTAALVRAQHPQWPDAQVPATLITQTIIDTLQSTSEPIDGSNPDYEGALGSGRVQAGAATAAGPVQPKLGDLNADGAVNAGDLAILLGTWGPCSGSCVADLDLDGSVTAADLAVLIGSWG